MSWGKIVGWTYVGAGALTLAFQVYVRLPQCTGVGCTTSISKGLVWSIVWPLGWVAYFFG
jgi:hypothetical protein